MTCYTYIGSRVKMVGSLRNKLKESFVFVRVIKSIDGVENRVRFVPYLSIS